MAFTLSLIEKWPEPMLLMDGERFIEANPAAVDLLGYGDKSALLLRSPDEISPVFQPDGERSLDKALELLGRAHRGESLRFDWLHLAADGREIHVDVTLSPIRHDDRQIVLCAWHDISQLKRAQQALAESESRFRSLFEMNTSLMVLIDPVSGRIMDANEAAADFYGYPRQRLLGMQASEISMMPAKMSECAWQKTLREGSNHYFTEHRLADGEVRDVEVDLTAIESGGPPFLFAIVHDVTDRRRAEKASSLANEALLKSNLELKHFAHAAAHDLQTPLRTIALFTQLLHKEAREQLSDQARQWTSMVVDGSRRMQALIDDLLAYSRLDSPTRSLEPTSCRRLFDEVLSNLGRCIGEAGAEVVCGELPTVLADRSQLVQVLQNLIENGIKYNQSEVPRIRVSARRELDTWIFTVADNGIGIAPKYHSRVFEIFRRLHSQEEYPGTGIGLAICQRVIERHGGRLWLESDEGQGSSFHFSLPAVDGIDDTLADTLASSAHDPKAEAEKA